MDGPFNTLGALTQAIGVELQLLSGTPITALVANFAPGDTILYVQSTLGFPPAGYVRVGSVQVYYDSKTPTRLTDLTYDHLVTVPARSVVRSEHRKLLPDSYELFWEYPWLENNFLHTTEE